MKKKLVKYRKHLGFTLAEVLVTLAIIGVVAALTIPGLIVSIQDAQNEAAAKKAYSELAAAWTKYINDKGGSPIGTFTDSYNLREVFLKKYFAYSRAISTATGYTHTYQHLYDNNSNTNQNGIITNNGVFIGFINANTNCQLYGTANFCSEVVIDVNGYKAPNRLGYDVFPASLMRDRLIPHDPRYADNHDVNNRCVKPGNSGGDSWTNVGFGCLKRILTNQPKWSG